jgi:small-conductance mechanosensitive channel
MFPICLAAQESRVYDSIPADSITLYSLQIANQHTQQKLDSLAQLQLLKQLEGLEKNTKRAIELENELKRLKDADSIRKSDQLKRIELLRQSTQGYPVKPFGDTLYMLHLKLGITRPEQRALNISQRIIRLYDDHFFKPDSIKVVEAEAGYEVVYKGNETILAVTEGDALWYNESPQALAQSYANKVIEAVQKEKAENSIFNWVKRIASVIAMLLGVFLLVTGIQKLFTLIYKWLLKRRNQWFKGLHIGKFRVLSGTSQAQFIFKLLTGLKWLIIGLAIYLSLPMLFSLLPGTEYITNTLLDWIVSPAKKLFSSIIDFLPNVFMIGIVYFFTAYLVKILRYFMLQIETNQLSISGFHSDFAKPTFSILRFVLYAFMLVIIFPYLPGSGSPAFQGISVFIGVLLSLGSSSAINNVIAGLVITYMRPFKPGDRIKIGDITGDVLEKTMLVIKLRTPKNEEITIPNSTILSNNTLNYSAFSKENGLVLHTTITIGYDVPWRKVHDLLLHAAKNTQGVNESPAPFVWQTSLNDYHISYQLNVYTGMPEKQGSIYAALHASIQDAFRDAGIEILSPAYASLRNGAGSTVPPNDIKKQL